MAKTFFDFFSATDEWILKKLDWKQVLNVLFQFCVFRVNLYPCLQLADTISKTPVQLMNGMWWNLTRSKYSMSCPVTIFFFFFGGGGVDLSTKMAHQTSNCRGHFWLAPWFEAHYVCWCTQVTDIIFPLGTLVIIIPWLWPLILHIRCWFHFSG